MRLWLYLGLEGEMPDTAVHVMIALSKAGGYLPWVGRHVLHDRCRLGLPTTYTALLGATHEHSLPRHGNP